MTFRGKNQARKAFLCHFWVLYFTINRQRRYYALNRKSPLEYYQDEAQAF